LANQSGFAVETIKMDPRCFDFLTQCVGVQTVCTGDTIAALKDAKPYDVIVLWQVIEHLTEAFETLAAMSDRLLPGGILLLAAPNPDSVQQFRVLHGRWAHLDAPRHVVLIPLSLLLNQVRKLGLEAIWMTTRDKGALG
jgi:2-polyprenyl-3-methyl-5-hydroxy-6-metoxy-1,4-benzoquinol methylase